MNPHHSILTPEAHRDLRVRIDRDVALGDGVMTSVVMPAEFRDAQQHYPILFRLNAERDDSPRTQSSASRPERICSWRARAGTPITCRSRWMCSHS